MMLPTRRSHQRLACVFIVAVDFRQKRGKGIVAVSGMLDGCLGSGDSRHLASWTCVKVVDRIEEVEDGVTIIRERERFTQTLTLAFRDGRTAILTDGTKGAG